MQYMVFDVESAGLHGEGFAVGWVLIDDRGIEYANGHYGCPLEHARKQDDDSLAWVKAHCDWPDNCARPQDVRDQFWNAYNDYFYGIPGMRTLLAADVPWPVESRFLHAVFADNPSRRERAPYPLIDIASVRLAAGLDPLATERRFPEELPAHNALADARQSARLLLEALRLIRGPLDGGKGEPPHIEPRRTYRRRDDMSPDGVLQILGQDDGDIIVSIVPPKEQEHEWMHSVEFCSLGGGGGRSKHTRKALVALALAMEQDNRENPIALDGGEGGGG